MTDSLRPEQPTTPARGAAFAIAMRWSDRLIGLVSTLVLARLLVPADFGLVAMAMVVVGLLDALLDLGVSSALIQRSSSDSDDYSTAWTLRLLQALASAILLATFAPYIADYYRDERVEGILHVIALTVLVAGFENIGIVSFQKNMEFGRDFRFFFMRRMTALVFTVSAAFLLQSYWALVLGSLFSRALGVSLSYWVSKFRPRPTLCRFAELWTFSKWKVVGGLAEYLYGSVDRLIIGRIANASTLGSYTVGQEIGTLPTTELLAPMGRVMFPAFASARDDATELLRIVALALSIQALIGIPAGLGVALVAGEAIPLLLGDQWHAAVPFTQLLALAGLATALEHSSVYLLLALGHVRTLSTYYWCRLVALAAVIAILVPRFEAQGVAMAKVITAYIGLFATLALGRRVLPGLSVRVLIESTWRPLVAAALMAVAILGLSESMRGATLFTRLVGLIVAGGVIYTCALIALWRLAGSPEGAETYLLQKLPLPKVVRRLIGSKTL